MRILLRKIDGVFGAVIGNGTWYSAPGIAPMSLPMAGLHLNLLAASWLPFLAVPVLLALALVALLGGSLPALPALHVSAHTPITADSLMSVSLIAGTINAVYDTAELTGVVNSMKGLVNGIHATFFNQIRTSEHEYIAFDVDEGKRYRAPYVHPKSAGKPRNLRGFQTKTFSPAYIKMLTVVDPDRPLKRAMGEALLGERTAQQRLDDAVTQQLSDDREYIDRRLEEQAVSVLKNGSVTISGEDYPETVVNFGRHASLNIGNNTLTGAERWNQSTADPLKNFRNWSKKSVKQSGSILRDFIMDSDAYDDFRSLESIDKKFNAIRIDPGSMRTNLAQSEGLILRGECDGHLIWTYDGFYTDENGDEQDMMSGGIVLGVGAIDGVTNYGAIKDFKAGMKAVPIFSKAWEEENPSGLQLLSQSAPLVTARRINASLCAKVRNNA